MSNDSVAERAISRDSYAEEALQRHHQARRPGFRRRLGAVPAGKGPRGRPLGVGVSVEKAPYLDLETMAAAFAVDQARITRATH
jgi:hypothetical protein